MSTLRKVVWDEGMPQESIQWVDENGNTVTPPDDTEHGEVWDKGMPQESTLRK